MVVVPPIALSSYEDGGTALLYSSSDARVEEIYNTFVQTFPLGVGEWTMRDTTF
jgi:hypothetical protein